jgi:VanZ family protein
MASGEAPSAARPGPTGLLAAVNLVYATVLIVLAYIPHIPAPLGVRVSDVVAHGVAYGLQALLLLMLLRRLASPAVAALGACLGTGVFGGLTELVQFLQPTRATQLSDLAADCLGAAIAVALGSVVLVQPRGGKNEP